MTAVALSFPKAFRVRFSQTERWNVSFFKVGSWHWEKGIVQPVSAFTNPIVEPLTFAEAQQQNIPIISKITFNGELVLKEASEYKDYKGRLFLVRPHSVIFSKINARRGCIFYVPEGHRVFAVSGEYPVLALDRNRAIGEYVNLALRVGPARENLLGGASGMAKARTYLEDFQKVKIPLPPLDEQRRIVAAWQQAQEKAAKAQERVEQVEQESEARFYIDLGLKPPKKTSRLKTFAVWWKDFERWSVSYSQAAQSGTDITHGKYPIYELDSLLEFVQYGTSEKANTSEDGTPVIRMNNIVDGVLDLSDLKHVKLIERDRERLLLKNNDILFNRTNSKELVGKCAVFHESGDYVFASYLIRIRPDPAKADSDFVAYVINSSIGRQQINAISRQIIGQANVNSEELRDLQIPLPPLDIQKEIMRRVEAGRSKIRHEQEAAAKVAEESESEVERMILGLLKA